MKATPANRAYLLIAVAIIVSTSAFAQNAVTNAPLADTNTLAQFQQAVTAYQRLPNYFRDGEKIARLTAAMGTLPTMPPDARQNFIMGQTILKAAATTNDFLLAAGHFYEANTNAPWIADIWYDLALARGGANDYNYALHCLKIYQVFKLSPEDAQNARDKFAEFQAKYQMLLAKQAQEQQAEALAKQATLAAQQAETAKQAAAAAQQAADAKQAAVAKQAALAAQQAAAAQQATAAAQQAEAAKQDAIAAQQTEALKQAKEAVQLAAEAKQAAELAQQAETAAQQAALAAQQAATAKQAAQAAQQTVSNQAAIVMLPDAAAQFKTDYHGETGWMAGSWHVTLEYSNPDGVEMNDPGTAKIKIIDKRILVEMNFIPAGSEIVTGTISGSDNKTVTGWTLHVAQFPDVPVNMIINQFASTIYIQTPTPHDDTNIGGVRWWGSNSSARTITLTK
jgi:hypothetical protein